MIVLILVEETIETNSKPDFRFSDIEYYECYKVNK